MNPKEALRVLGIRFVEAGGHHHVGRGWLGMDCPNCSPGWGKYRLGLGLRKLRLSCWVCGPLPLVRTLSTLSGAATSHVAALFRGALPSREEPEKVRGRLRIPMRLGPLLPAHRQYLEGRWPGADPDELVREWGIGGLGRDGTPAWHVWIPIRDGQRTVSWTARSIAQDARRRYVTARADQEDVPARSLLYGAEKCEHAIIVHEGPIDAWRTGPGAVATLGIDYTAEQFSRIAGFPLRVVCFDSDGDAQRRARRLCDDLKVLPGRTLNVLLDAHDAASAPQTEIDKLRRLIR